MTKSKAIFRKKGLYFEQKAHDNLFIKNSLVNRILILGIIFYGFET